MVIVMIRRFVRLDKEADFLQSYRDQKPVNNPAFKGETLTRASDDAALPPGLTNLQLRGEGCVTYINIAKWDSWQAFNAHFDPQVGVFDPKIETAPRERAVFEVI